VLQRTEEAVWKSFRNLPDVQCIDVAELNAYDVLVNDWLVFTTETLPRTLPRTAAGTPSGAEPSAPEAQEVAP